MFIEFVVVFVLISFWRPHRNGLNGVRRVGGGELTGA